MDNTSASTPITPFPLWVEHHPPRQATWRVALVTETYPPEINGVAITLARLVAGLQARNHAVQLVRPRQPRSDGMVSPISSLEEVLMRGLPIPNYPHLRMGLPAKKQLLTMWTRHRPDVVHIATEGPLGWSALQAARKLKLPISSDFRTNFHAYSRHYGVGWLQKPIAAYLRKFHNLADRTMVPTASLHAALDGLGFERLHTVARGIDTTAFHPQHRDAALRATWGVSDAQRVVLCVGRLAPEKNLTLLAESFEAMQQVDPHMRLVVVGDGPSRTMLQARCPNARFVGSQTGEALARHYASADVFLFPSLTETYGNVTPEALASGLAVLAFDHAAAAELIRHGHHGLLVSPDDPAAFVRRAVDLANSPTLCEQLRTQARASVVNRDWASIVQQVESVWEELLTSSASARNGDRAWRTEATVS
jgi:glycosyltransferase involved in cell wall biosynthesis